MAKESKKKLTGFWSTDVDLFCPVVPTLHLGIKPNNSAVSVWCEDCAFWHDFGPDGEKPKSHRRPREKETCGCDGCRWRDNNHAK